MASKGHTSRKGRFSDASRYRRPIEEKGIARRRGEEVIDREEGFRREAGSARLWQSSVAVMKINDLNMYQHRRPKQSTLQDWAHNPPRNHQRINRESIKMVFMPSVKRCSPGGPISTLRLRVEPDRRHWSIYLSYGAIGRGIILLFAE